MFLFKNKKILYFFVFLLFLILILILFRSLFFSYFEADEWFHFTYYFPLTRKPDGLFTAFISTFVNAGPLSGGQHVVPVASVIYFLNTKFFGMNYVLYAFMSLLLHAINGFLVFLLIKTLLYKKEIIQKNIFALLGSIFFIFAPNALHTVTGAAPFYGQNILSVTFFLLCLLSFKLAYNNNNKKYIYFAIFFLFLSLFTKETAVFLFLILPLMAAFEKRIFPRKFLGKLFIVSVCIYVVIRFIIPNFYFLPEVLIDKWIGNYIPSAYQIPKKANASDTGTIISTDLSIHKNLPVEILFRTATFPLKMMGTVFVGRETVQAIVQVITPVIVPVPPGGDPTGQMSFFYGSGNTVVIYFISISILLFCTVQLFRFIKKKQIQEAQALATGLAIIIFSALPLVAIIFSFPRWGYDFYFDSRYYYNPAVGAAIVFPFLLFGIAKFISQLLRIKKVLFVIVVLVLVWLMNVMYEFTVTLKYFVNKYGSDRREVVEQMKKLLPQLAQKTVFYIETDGLSAYGPILPFQTSVPQALTVVYYDKNPLPDSFFKMSIFDGKEGYLFSEGRGLGYYISKKSLADALFAKKFTVDDIYSFYYESQKVILSNKTSSTRRELEKYLEERKKIADWKLFEASPSANETMTFLYPPNTEVIDNPVATTEAKLLKDLQINNSQFATSLKIIRTAPTVDINELTGIFGNINDSETISKKVFFDRYHVNDALVVLLSTKAYYFMKFDDLLITTTTNTDKTSLSTLEKILGSVAILKKN